MKRILAVTLIVCLLLCGCQLGDLIPAEPATEPSQTQTPTEASTEAPTETPTEAPTETPTEAPTEPVQAQPEKVTVYLLEKAVYFDSGHTEYSYDKNYNIDEYETVSLEGDWIATVYFREKDKNGMPNMIWEELAGSDDGSVHLVKYSEGGKMTEDQYDSNTNPYSGYQYEYDQKGNLVEKREYYDGILQSTVIYEYQGSKLFRAYCEDPQGNHIYDYRVENGVIIEKVGYSSDGSFSYRYEYDANGNLVKESMLYEGELIPVTTYIYKAVEVSANRAQYLLEQQKYLTSIT